MADPATTTTPVTPASNKRRNWYFICIRIILIEASLVILFSSTIYIWQSTNALNIFGSVLSQDCTSDQAFNNIWRHLSIFWLSFAPSCILIACNIQRYAPLLLLHSLTLFMAGCMRLWTAWIIGIPGTPMGYFLVYITTFFDVTTPLLVVLFYGLGVRCQRKIDSCGDGDQPDGKQKTS